ncbi:MAG TPA: hypothetical protein VGI19_07225 [Candidatus Cybelea sp.]|jgi:hypothetical protein
MTATVIAGGMLAIAVAVVIVLRVRGGPFIPKPLYWWGIGAGLALVVIGEAMRYFAGR